MNYPWEHKRRYNAYAEYMKQKFGGRIQKVSVDAGFTCPNRDGKVSKGGCTFCNNNAFSPSYCFAEKPIKQQILEGINFHKKRYKKAQKFVAYFQVYSNTYAPLSELTAIYEQALELSEVFGLVIGTRPDCVDEEKLDFFAELSKKAFITLEYGIESCYNKTLEKINRGHTFEQSVWAIKETAKRGISVGGHMIFGLPGESRKEMINQTKTLSQLPLTSIKFHQLQVIKGTQLAKDFVKDKSGFELFSMDEYIEFCVDFVERFNPQIYIQRIAGESPPDFIEANYWGKRYDEVLREFENRLEERITWQGKFYT